MPAKPTRVATAKVRGQIDFAILTVREDEEAAIHARFAPSGEVDTAGTDGARWPYALSSLPVDGGYYNVAMVRCLHQGTNQAQRVATDLIADLAPKWLMTVGIAGGFPDDDYSLGDVILSSYVYDVSVTAENVNGETEYSVTGGFLPAAVEMMLSSLGARRAQFNGWGSRESISVTRPEVVASAASCAGDEEYRSKLRRSLAKNFGTQSARSEPTYRVAGVVSSSRLIKNPDIVVSWRTFARRASAVEMEFAGVYSAARGRAAGGADLPIITIRGLSDIVGLERDAKWTEYACHSAAAFTKRLVEAADILPTRPHPLIQHESSLATQPISSGERVTFRLELNTESEDEAIEWFRRVNKEFGGDAKLIRAKGR